MVTDKEYKELYIDCEKVAVKYRIDVEEIGDILHNIYLSSYNKEITNVKGYFYKAFINRCIDITRKRKYNTVDIFDTDKEEEIEIEDVFIEKAATIIDTVNENLLLHIPEIDKQLFRAFILANVSFTKLSLQFNIAKAIVISKVNNLVRYLCFINTGKMYIKNIIRHNKRIHKKVMVYKIRKQEYMKYADCITSAHLGYSFNYEVFKTAGEEMLGMTFSSTDKHNKEKLKQAAQKLYDELYVVDKELVEEVKINIEDDKDTTTIQPTRKRTNKKSLRQD